jgi:Transglutaminase-like superfamily
VPRRAALRRLRRRLPHVLRLPPGELLATLHALVVLVVVELSIRWVRLPHLARLLGVRLDLGPVRTDHADGGPVALPDRSLRRLRGTARVVHVWPFCQGPCLRQSLVAAHLLRDQHAAVRLGVAGTGSDVRAHAWIEIDGRPLEDVAEFIALELPAPASVA